MILDEAILAATVDDYRHLHRHPELSGQEFSTREYLRECLAGMGLEIDDCSPTGLVVRLVNGPGPIVAYRADMDGLPLTELTGLEYASVAESKEAGGTGTVGVMHACGHDLHMSIAIALIRHLDLNRESWSGTLAVIFQPAEETAAGARSMIEDDVWAKVGQPSIIFAQHAWPAPVGTVEVVPGDFMAMADSFEVSVAGRGGHSSQPETTIDPVVLAAHMIVRLQTVVSRRIAPLDAAVLTVAYIRAGAKENVIADSAIFGLNLRYFDHQVRKVVLDAINQVLEGEALASGAPAPSMRVLNSFPLLRNDIGETERLAEMFEGIVGAGNVTRGTQKLGSEDFGHFGESASAPQVYWLLGAQGESSQSQATERPGLHSPHFAPEPIGAIRAGTLLATTACLSYLDGPKANQDRTPHASSEGK
ncbi:MULTISPECIES: amidohydrolase [unclassified Nocardioides]|uniref:amidohydrolase n=1 Tax=unclassified Nocardioides TaxID=2615069 RepID=UPI0009F0A163|nr:MULTISPECIES: amidohydrolase [unclassified Nocardioides]GAW48996.1 Putative hydrolase [Nocardioides sp. PD653-B2]GAW55211.1 putative hydrolase [Nocardioides sp. PD653]